MISGLWHLLPSSNTPRLIALSSINAWCTVEDISPELYNLDSNLNQDVHLAVTDNINMTMELNKEDLQKSLMTTLKAGAKDYCCIFHSNTSTAPSSKIIIDNYEYGITTGCGDCEGVWLCHSGKEQQNRSSKREL